MPLNTSGEEALTTWCQEECSSHEQRGAKKNKGDSHTMTVGCGKPESFLHDGPLLCGFNVAIKGLTDG